MVHFTFRRGGGERGEEERERERLKGTFLTINRASK